MSDVVIPAWAWGLLTMLFAAGLTMVGTILRAYTQSVDDKFKITDDKLENQGKRIGMVEVDVAGLKAKTTH